MTAAVDEALSNARAHLLGQRNPGGYWEGELSASALSTATAMVALKLIDPRAHEGRVVRGMNWLREHQNADGGFGDTPISLSNLPTSVLCWAAIALADDESSDVGARVAGWIERHCGSLAPQILEERISALYGKDRTFSVPILMTAAIGGRLGGDGWLRVRPLPFELAALPRGTFALLRLPVVSYALPALIAIGQARFHHAPPANPWKSVRTAAIDRTRRLLHAIQPESGGYLEATPLTSFVGMALASCGWRDDPVVHAAERFLTASQRADGSWPIDTNLATWVTTLAVNALAGDVPDPAALSRWLLDQQHQRVHRYTDAPPGGWAWTNLTGGVPDADDTAGALLALKRIAPGEMRSAEAALLWLMSLQNRDGGIPTFCRGWGALPFDRSSPDLTAHTLRAWAVWAGNMDGRMQRRLAEARGRALAYLTEQQNGDGSWTPLWFGNQHRGDETNPTYGTAQVCRALPVHDASRQRAVDWLLRSQNEDGGWGGGEGTPSSIEESALALRALVADGAGPEVQRGVKWLIDHTDAGRAFPPSPIGFYFARLWYHEKLYPVVWSVDALRKVRAALTPPAG